jgi:hypothetical protein
MSLLSDESPRVASPRLRLVPGAVDTEGTLACDLASHYGLTAFVWQRAALVDMMGVRADGRWAASRAGLSVPRQNGKNGAVEIYELWVTSQLGMRVLHSAHEVKTARKAFKRLLDFFDNPRQYPELFALVSEVRRTNGQEAIELHNGGGVEFVARTKSSGRGYSADVLVLDEAQELTDDELEAMQPTISASANPQTVLTGTPPKRNKPAVVWRRFRAAGAAGIDPKLCWIEHSAIDGDDLDARSTWAEANPGAPESIGWDTIADERAAMSDEGFAVERCGIWLDSQGADSVIDPQVWASLTADSPRPAQVTFSLEITNGRASAAVGVAWKTATGVHVEVAEAAEGVGWLAAWFSRSHIRGTVVIDGGSEAASFEAELTAAGMSVLKIGGAERAIACASIYDAALDRSLSHDGDPLLADAVSSAAWKDVGEGSRVFSRRRSSGDISHLYAVTLARFGAASVKPRPGNFFSF